MALQQIGQDVAVYLNRSSKESIREADACGNSKGASEIHNSSGKKCWNNCYTNQAFVKEWQEEIIIEGLEKEIPFTSFI